VTVLRDTDIASVLIILCHLLKQTIYNIIMQRITIVIFYIDKFNMFKTFKRTGFTT